MMSCGEQWLALKDLLEDALTAHEFDEHWTFDSVAFLGGVHVWGNARSDNPNDPLLVIDPWENSFSARP